MNINATLLVQAGNFFVTYLIIRYVFLRPAVAAIDFEERSQEGVARIIAQREQEIAALEKRRKKQWLACHHFFKQHRPDTEQDDLYIFKRITPLPTYPVYTVQERTAYAQVLRDQLLHAIKEHNDRH